MSLLYDWVSKIILFMLIGTIIEMLLPSNELKKYVHFVFGLLFLLLLAQPIFYLFKTDITEQISSVEKYLLVDEGEVNRTKTTIEKQKNDIQAEQDAYIWNELKAQYMSEANPTLEEVYDLEIKEIRFKQNENNELYTIIVSLQSVEDDQSIISVIEPIEINKESKPVAKVNNSKTDQIEQSLRTIWQLDETVSLELWQEGGRLD